MDKSCLICCTQMASPSGNDVSALKITDFFQIQPNSFAKYNKGDATVKTVSYTFTTDIPHLGYTILVHCHHRIIKLATHYYFDTFYMIL